MEFEKIFGDPKPEPDWYGVLNFTLAVYLDCKWHQYKYAIEIAEDYENKIPKWSSKTPDPAKTVVPKPAESKSAVKTAVAVRPPEPKPPEPKPAEEPPPEGEKPKKKIGTVTQMFVCIKSLKTRCSGVVDLRA